MSTTTADDSKLDLNKILSNAQLPALPQSAMRLLELSQDPKVGPNEFAVPIEADPGLTSQVLRFVNSSYFGFSREISSIALAINLVGVRTIKNFSLWSAVFSLMPNPKCGPLDLKGLWQDSLRRAIFARRVGQILGSKSADDQFAAALLQDMAVPLLAKEAQDRYAELIGARDQGRLRLSKLEGEAFGWTHAHAAGRMARQWNLPEAFAVMIEHHAEIDHWSADPQSEPGIFSVGLSALLPSSADIFWHEALTFDGHYDQLVPLGAPALPTMLATVDAEFEEFAPVLKLSTPAKSLAECCREAAEEFEGTAAG